MVIEHSLYTNIVYIYVYVMLAYIGIHVPSGNITSQTNMWPTILHWNGSPGDGCSAKSTSSEPCDLSEIQ